MKRQKFKLSHSLLGMGILLIVEHVLLGIVPAWAAAIIYAASLFGALINVYVATEVIEEVRGARHMLLLLSAVVAEFLVFFAFQYFFLTALYPASFPTLGSDPVSLLLSSVMVFVFNPIYQPGDAVGRMLLLINTISALGLVLFILQNVWQFRRNK